MRIETIEQSSDRLSGQPSPSARSRPAPRLSPRDRQLGELWRATLASAMGQRPPASLRRPPDQPPYRLDGNLTNPQHGYALPSWTEPDALPLGALPAGARK